MAAENQCSREIALPGGVREGKGGSIEWTHLRWACHVLFCNAMPWQCIARAFLARAVARALPKPWRAKALGAVAQGLDKTLGVSGLSLPLALCRRAMAGPCRGAFQRLTAHAADPHAEEPVY